MEIGRTGPECWYVAFSDRHTLYLQGCRNCPAAKESSVFSKQVIKGFNTSWWLTLNPLFMVGFEVILPSFIAYHKARKGAA